MLKSFVGSGSWKYTWVLALGLLGSGGASALECTTDPTSGCTVTFTGGYEIGTDGNFVNTPAGVWIKNLTGAGLTPEVAVTMTEHLNIPFPESRSGWTETIGAGWEWLSGTLVFNSIFDFGTVVVSNDGTTITFSGFNADTQMLDPPVTGTPIGDIEFTITKTLVCHLADVCTDGVVVVENAVPEPGTLLLLAGGLAGLAGLRRRRYA